MPEYGYSYVTRCPRCGHQIHQGSLSVNHAVFWDCSCGYHGKLITYSRKWVHKKYGSQDTWEGSLKPA